MGLYINHTHSIMLLSEDVRTYIHILARTDNITNKNIRIKKSVTLFQLIVRQDYHPYAQQEDEEKYNH